MNVSLTPKLEKLIQKKVQSGLYSSASEVVREALRVLEQNDAYERKLREFRAELDRGIAELDAGLTLDGEEVFAKLREKSRLRRKKTA